MSIMHYPGHVTQPEMPGRRSSVLLLHTLGASAATWGPLLERRAGDRPAVAVDLPGHGSRAAEPFTVRGALDIVRRAAAGCGHGPVHVVGSGLGAYVALRLVSAYPESVRSLVLAGYAPVDRDSATARIDATTDAIRRLGSRAFGSLYLRETLVGDVHGDTAGIAAAIADVRGETFLAALTSALSWTPGPEAARRRPVLVLRGEHDGRVTRTRAVSFAQELRGRYAELGGAGHLSYVEDPLGFWQAASAFIDGTEI